MNYDIIIIGSGPGGYVAAIRASQLGKKVAVVERAELGGICLNWGCIPVKSLLKSAKVYEDVKNAADYGIKISGDVSPDINGMIKRSRAVAEEMSKGVQYLFKKNKIDYIKGFGKLVGNNKVRVEGDNGKYEEYVTPHIILATGARPKELSNLKFDGKKIIGYREAITLNKMPESMIIIGSGAIGSEFAYFYNSIGVDVTLIEFLPNIVPLEDEEVSKQLGRSFMKAGMKVMTGTLVEKVDINGEKCKVGVKNKNGEMEIEADIVLSAVGIIPNLENIGLEEVGIEMDKDKVKVNEYYQTNVKGIYAIGDIVEGQSLAHVASAEGIICVENISGKTPDQLNYKNIPSCTYTSPEVASVGMKEKEAIEAGYKIKVGKFPFTASGKARAIGEKEGFVKLIFDARYGELLGGHMIGANVTEMIAEIVVARKLEITGPELIKSVHPHPTMSEAVMEAAAAAYDGPINI